MWTKERIVIAILVVVSVVNLYLYFDGRGKVGTEPTLSSEEVWKAIEEDFPENVISVVNQAIQEERARQQQSQAEQPTP